MQDVSDTYVEETFKKNQYQIKLKLNFDQKDNSVNADFVISTIKSTTTKVCEHCDQNFESENKLHHHLEKCSIVQSINKSAAFSVTSKSSSKKKRILIESSLKSLQIINYIFRDWQYITVKVCWSLNESEEDIILDIECIMTIVNHKFIEFIASNTSIQKMTSLISVQDIKNKIHHFNDFVMLITYIHEFLSDDRLTTTCFRWKIHLINDFRIKILLEIDIMITEKMQLDLNKKIFRINSCQEFTVNIFILTRNLSNLKRIVQIKDWIVISSHALLKVSVLVKKNKLSTDRDLIFKSDYDQDLRQTSNLFTHVVDVNFFFVQVWNDIEKSIIIQQHARIEAMLKYEEDDCFLTNSMNHYLMIIDWKQHKTFDWKSSLLREVSVLVIIIVTLSTANLNLLSFSTSTVLNLLSIKVNSDLKIILQNNITIYDINQIVIVIAKIINFYDIWTDQENTVDILKKNWMSITLVSETKISSARVYSLSTKDKKLIDEIFDKLHEQHKLTWIEQSTLYNFSVSLYDEISMKFKKACCSWHSKSKQDFSARQLFNVIASDYYNCRCRMSIHYHNKCQWLFLSVKSQINRSK